MERDDERVACERERIEALFEQLPDTKRKLLEKLIENVAWQAVMLDDLRESIDIDSIVAFDERSGLYKRSALFDAYATMSNQHTQGIMKLYALVPEEAEPPDDQADTWAEEVNPLERARREAAAARQSNPEA